MALSADEKTQLVNVLEEMGVKPKTDSVADFEAWMRSYLSSKGVEGSTIQVVTQPPQLAKFSGDIKGDQVSFDLWRYEVRSLLKENLHKPEAIHQAVRRSLRGEASRVAMRLGSDASLESLLEKLEAIYGTIEFGEDILAQFYSAAQKENENVVSWGFRLENILDKAIEQKQISDVASKDMLRSKFWTGLNQHLKDATRHHFETEKDFDRLRVQVRRVEQEHSTEQKSNKKLAPSKVHTSTTSEHDKPTQEKQIDELREMMKNLVTKFDTLQEEVRKGSKNPGNPSNPGNQPSMGRKPPASYNRPNPDPPRRIEPDCRERNQRPSWNPAPENCNPEEPLCYKCGRFGHLSFGCRAKESLNY